MTRSMTCSCGEMKWRIAEGAPGTHCVCYCADCRSFANHLNKSHMLEDGGSHLFQTLPEHFHIEQGEEHLKMLRLSPKGMFRWYAGCCDTPIANTLTTTALPFVGVLVPKDSDSYGKVQTRTSARTAPVKVKEFGVALAAIKLLRRGIVAKLAGHTQTPFFNDEGAPVRKAKILTLEERNAARS